MREVKLITRLDDCKGCGGPAEYEVHYVDGGRILLCETCAEVVTGILDIGIDEEEKKEC